MFLSIHFPSRPCETFAGCYALWTLSGGKGNYRESEFQSVVATPSSVKIWRCTASVNTLQEQCSDSMRISGELINTADSDLDFLLKTIVSNGSWCSMYDSQSTQHMEVAVMTEFWQDCSQRKVILKTFVYCEFAFEDAVVSKERYKELLSKYGRQFASSVSQYGWPLAIVLGHLILLVQQPLAKHGAAVHHQLISHPVIFTAFLWVMYKLKGSLFRDAVKIQRSHYRKSCIVASRYILNDSSNAGTSV